MIKCDMGPKTGYASDVLVTIYVWVSTLLAVVILQSATVIKSISAGIMVS